MSEHDTDATLANQVVITPLIRNHPFLRFLEGAGDGAAGTEGSGDGDGSGDGTDEGNSTGDGDSDTESDALGDAGKKALDAMKQQRNAAKAEARQMKAELDRLKAEAANKDKPAEEQALEAARAEATATATAAANKRILKSELKALATGKLADPTDAALYINLDDFTVDDNGDVDSDALTEAITELLTRKPHLAVQDARKFQGTGDQGAKGKKSVGQLTREQLKDMSPDQIVAAQDAGRLNDLLGIK